MKQIILPNHLLSPAYVAGLRQPLEAVAEQLDIAGKYEFASALRNAATICEVFTEVCLTKEANLVLLKPLKLSGVMIECSTDGTGADASEE